MDRVLEEGLAEGRSTLPLSRALGRAAELFGGVGEDGEDGEDCAYSLIKSLALKVLEGNGERLEFSAENCSAFGSEREVEKFSDGLTLGSCAVSGGWSGVMRFETVGQL